MASVCFCHNAWVATVLSFVAVLQYSEVTFLHLEIIQHGCIPTYWCNCRPLRYDLGLKFGPAGARQNGRQASRCWQPAEAFQWCCRCRTSACHTMLAALSLWWCSHMSSEGLRSYAQQCATAVQHRLFQLTEESEPDGLCWQIACMRSVCRGLRNHCDTVSVRQWQTWTYTSCIHLASCCSFLFLDSLASNASLTPV